MNIKGILAGTAKELLNDAFPIIEKCAPSIAGAIGGVPGFALGFILPALSKAFNAPSGDIPQLVTNILNDPDNKAKLAKIQDEHGWIATLSTEMNRLAGAEITVRLNWITPNMTSG